MEKLVAFALLTSAIAAPVAHAAKPAPSHDLAAIRAWRAAQPRSFDNQLLFSIRGEVSHRADRLGTEETIPGDFDGDFDIDTHDYFAFSICISFSGPDLETPPACDTFDSDVDGDIDLADANAFLLAFTGSTSRLLVEAGDLVPIRPSTQTYYSGEPAEHGNNALHGLARQAGFSQDDLWYEWSSSTKSVDAGPVIIANVAQPATAYRLQPLVTPGEYTFLLTVTNLFTFETGSDDVTLSVIPCQTDVDCDDGRFCTAFDECDLESPSAGIDGCLHYGSPCKCTVSGMPCNSALGDRKVCDEASTSCHNCTIDAECDDGVACTNDTCLAGLCIAAPIHARCSNGLLCDKELGCIPPP